MKKFIASYLLASTFIIAGCGDKSQGADPKEQIAGDKAQIVALLKIADTKGTVAEAFVDAATDPSLRAKMQAALASPSASAASSSTPTKTTSSSTAAPKKDALDRASDAVDDADKKVTKSGEIIDKAGQVKKKTEDIFNKPR